MKDNFIWLSISLFCAKNNWNELFKNGIIPFLNNDQDYSFHLYTIELNYLSGENIRLSLLVDEKSAENLTLSADKRIQQHVEIIKSQINTAHTVAEALDPLLLAEILFKFSISAENDAYYALANKVIQEQENDFWNNIKHAESTSATKHGIGFRYLYLAQKFNKTSFVEKSLYLIKQQLDEQVNKLNDSTIDIKNALNDGLALIMMTGNCSAGLMIFPNYFGRLIN